MLLDLEISDFAIIDTLSCRFDAGFNVLTGETGAGKSIIVDALGLLVGDRADTTMVRAGCERAVIQAVFEQGSVEAALAPVLEAYGVPPEPELVLTREVLAEGRSVARANGRVVPIRALAEIGRILVDIHGQGESTSLKRPAEHIELLDSYAGLAGVRARFAAAAAEMRALEGELAALRASEAAAARRAEDLAYWVDEIDGLGLSAEEEAALLGERTRLANAERLALLASTAYAALSGTEDGRTAALDGLDEATKALAELREIDPELSPAAEELASSTEAVRDAARSILAYRDRLEFDPARLSRVEERLAAYADAKRKYGPEVADVLEHGRRAAAELAGLLGASDRIAEIERRLGGVGSEVGALAGELSKRRRLAADALETQVERELAALGMPGSSFEVHTVQSDDPTGVPVGDRRLAFDATGVDDVSFHVSANPGEPPRPLVAVASGGETARIMLALKTVLQAADRVPVLVFDEIDAGIGGRVGSVVGEHLWSLTSGHQVLCVTHLPQVAAYGDHHLRVAKRVRSGRTQTSIEPLTGAERVDELTSMLGTTTEVGRQSADELLAQAASWRASQA